MPWVSQRCSSAVSCGTAWTTMRRLAWASWRPCASVMVAADSMVTTPDEAIARAGARPARSCSCWLPSKRRASGFCRSKDFCNCTFIGVLPNGIRPRLTSSDTVRSGRMAGLATKPSASRTASLAAWMLTIGGAWMARPTPCCASGALTWFGALVRMVSPPPYHSARPSRSSPELGSSWSAVIQVPKPSRFSTPPSMNSAWSTPALSSSLTTEPRSISPERPWPRFESERYGRSSSSSARVSPRRRPNWVLGGVLLG